MKRLGNQGDRPATGCRPVPLFNQKKRTRVPLTSAPSENEFFSHSEYRATSNSSSSSASGSGPGAYGYYQASSPPAAASQSHQWNRQNTPQSARSQPYGTKAAPGPAHTVRNYAPMPHPYKAPGTSSKVGQPSTPVRQQESSPSVKSRQSEYRVSCFSESPQSKPGAHGGFSPKAPPSFSQGPSPTHQFSQQSRPAPVPSPSRPGAQNNGWNFTNSFGSQKTSLEGNKNMNQSQTVRPTPTQQAAFPVKAAAENSLRILTAVIGGMRHWSQFKDKVPYLFEIFATLDSAVTLGRHGAKTFLMRDGKDVVQCVFYENEKALPRLIRGHVHRCVGNYDSSRDVLKCVSVRPGLPSEQRNALEAVKACDAEMRQVIKSLSEV